MIGRLLTVVALAVLPACSQPANNLRLPDGGEGEPDVGSTEDTSTEGDTGDGAACGNGVVDDGESCDSAITTGEGACPTDCDDNDECTTEELVGAGTCSATCEYTSVASCCGDGTLNGAEACDTAIAAGTQGACPTSCDDSDPCTTDELVDSGTCLARCVNTQQALCFGETEPVQVPATTNSAHPPEILAVDDQLWLFATDENGNNAAPVTWHTWDGTDWGDEGSLDGDSWVAITGAQVDTRPTIFSVAGGNQPWVNAFNGAAASPLWEWSTLDGGTWHAILSGGQTDNVVGAAAVAARVFLFTTTDSGTIEYASALAESGFESYQEVPGGQTSSYGPSAFADGTDVTVVTAAASTLRAARYDTSGDSWSNWIDFGPTFSADAAPDVLHESGLTVLAATSGGVASISYSEDNGSNWSDWTELTGDDIVGRPALAIYDGNLYVAVLRSAGTDSYWLYSAPLP